MIMLKSTHLAAMAKKDAEIAEDKTAHKTKVESLLAVLNRASGRHSDDESTLMDLSRKLAQANAELAELRAERDRRIAPLAKANAKRKADALARARQLAA